MGVVLVACTSALFAVTVLLLTIICWSLLRYKRFISAVGTAIVNEHFCDTQEGPCELQIDDTLVQPATIDDVFRPETARYCADLIARVALLYYDKKGLTTLRMPCNMVKLCDLPFDGNIIGYVAKSTITDVVWIAFRGTATEAEWRHDFQFDQGHFDYQQGRYESGAGERLLCHQGFLSMFEEFKQLMVDTVTAAQAQQVVITGHSLGAALATLASLELGALSQVYTYVFASPRVCDWIPATAEAMWRLNNTCDIVPHLPLAVMPNKDDIETPYIYTHGGMSIEFTDNRRGLGNNHLLPVYIDALGPPWCQMVAPLHVAPITKLPT